MKEEIKEGALLEKTEGYKKFVSIVGEEQAVSIKFFEYPFSQRTLDIFAEKANSHAKLLQEFLQKLAFNINFRIYSRKEIGDFVLFTF